MPYDLIGGPETREHVKTLPMRAVTFDGCVGWLHMPNAVCASDTAVVLCTGLAVDKLTGHRSFLHLAEALAGNLYPTLRFDYPATGDACDDDCAEHWTLWQHSIEHAIGWLRTHSGARRVVLIGLRIGAVLASLVAERRDDVAAVVLLDPVLRGRSYIRQLSIGLLLSGATAHDRDCGLDGYGLMLSHETVDHIGRVALRDIRLPAECQAAVFAQSTQGALAEVVTTWRARGTRVACEDFSGLDAFVRLTFLNHEGAADVGRIVRWLAAAVPANPLPSRRPPASPSVPLHGKDWIETPLFFGPQGRLFGILCRPRRGTPAPLATLIVNASADPHYGFSRQPVALARHLASLGMSSLRMDFAGIGDSIGTDDDIAKPSHIVETDRTPDITAALDALERLGYRRFAVQGLCTGAYHALRGAFTDHRISILLMVNLAFFQWKDGDRVENIGARSPYGYLRLAGKATTWRALAKRELSLDRPLHSLRSTFGDAPARARAALRRLLKLPPPETVAQTIMAALERRRVRVLLVYASSDPGLDILAHEFGPSGARLPAATITILPSIDHNLSSSAMRHVVTERLASFLKAAAADQ